MARLRTSRLPFLILAALGVVYGDIGTSPLYALRECFTGPHAIDVSRANVLGVLSLIAWSLVIVVSVKYLLFVMRADNAGEGGILALVALVRTRAGRAGRVGLIAFGLFGAALLYGDGMITPAISVLSAVEGLSIATHTFEPYVVPITVVILIVLFVVQSRGTSGIGTIFGPIMIGWFVMLALLGFPAIARNPIVLTALSPSYGMRFFEAHGPAAVLTLGAVVLVITGAEALYADMGHFGPRPIRIAWFTLVLPSLLVNYFGQGALLLTDAEARVNPFYHLAPSWALYPLVVVATIATVIASQAIISGAFSLTQQAVQLGYAPRFDIRHTSAQEKGQVYVPEINWLLMLATLGLVFGFKSSTNLASAYGMAVTATMVITTVLAYVVTRELWRWGFWRAGLITGAFLVIDLAFFSANLLKIEHGGWFPLLVAGAVYLVMSTWNKGRKLVLRRLDAEEVPLSSFFENLAAHPPIRVPGTAVFMTARPEGAPPILVHHLKHNKALHAQVVLLTVTMLDTPTRGDAAAIEVQPLSHGFYRLIARYGFMDTPDVPASLTEARRNGLEWRDEDMTYYLAHLTLFANDRIGMSVWRDKLFIFLSRNARRATNFFRLPPDRVVEIGIQLEI
ncbi:MAG: potassium transporter Kup [Acidobacteria bacterium]|nr:MAG: potassium transporter Kup [Acidobacteriota bacterium]PYQ87261.1 MAG: potassium transporter Kup [Acidobacteriota bacterium]PYQ89486.1 MAG: potassium transporter Kup [Acidobacteriota bacterium]